jgi:hypothetical protein
MRDMLRDSPEVRGLLIIGINPNHDVDGHTVLVAVPSRYCRTECAALRTSFLRLMEKSHPAQAG